MRYIKKFIFLLPVVSLTILSIGCQNSGNETGYDTGNNESEISQDAQVNDPDSDNKDDKEKVTISEKEAENILREYLVSANILKSDYVLEPLDPVLGEFKNEELFRFEMRHKEDADGYGGNLIANYDVTTDGERIYWYNPADDELVLQNGNGSADNAVLGSDNECGSDFHLDILDEETGEWRNLDTVIDFEWLYGKLKPGRYQIVKTVMDFRGIGDYTNYVYTAQFNIMEE